MTSGYDDVEPGYLLGGVLISILLILILATFLATAARPSPQRGPTMLWAGLYTLTCGCLFLAAYFFERKTLLFRGVIWLCVNWSHPSGRSMALLYGAGVFLGSIGVAQGLGWLGGR